MVKLNWNIFESRLRIFKTEKSCVQIEILVAICILGASFNCIFFKVRKQWISKSIQEVIKALVTIIFTIVFVYILCLIELLIWEYWEDGERFVWVRPLWQWVVQCLLRVCNCSLAAVRGKDSPSKRLRLGTCWFTAMEEVQGGFSFGDSAEKKVSMMRTHLDLAW